MSEFTLKGKHVAGMFVLGFGVIISVNLTLAVSAVRTFPGLEVKNSYVASQTFDRERAAQQKLEWDVSAHVEGETLFLEIVGPSGPVAPNIIDATLGRATHVQEDRQVDFTFDGTALRADVPALPSGNWNLRLIAEANDGTTFKQRVIVRVPQ